jgi:phospholipase/lecithinase/hemolysin
MVLMATTSFARASSFSAVVVYGDSLSDNGNLYALDGGIDPLSPPYFMGRFSNGPVAVEQLAALVGAPLEDFAVGGATSGVGNEGDGGTQTTTGLFGLPGMFGELAATNGAIATSPLTPSALFVVWGGANDFLANGSPALGAADIDAIVGQLEADGATHILVPGVPDLGLTPDFMGSAAATLYSEQFNADLQATLPAGATYFDTFDLLHQIVADPSAYGLTNVTNPCLVGATICPDPNQYLFWDGFHPTTTVDSILAQDMEIAATPEPSTILLLATGLAGLMGMVRLRRTA